MTYTAIIFVILVMLIRNAILIVLLSCVLSGCQSGSDDGPAALAPRITNLLVTPEVVCVGGAAEVSFTLTDANQDSISWDAQLSTSIHGQLDRSSGNVNSGSNVAVRFKAANSGRHRHRVRLQITASDSSGMQAEPAEVDLFVFNC